MTVLMNMYTTKVILLVVVAELVLCSHYHRNQNDETWPEDSSNSCSQTTKQKAMYGRMSFSRSLNNDPFKKMSVVVRFDDLQFAPHNTQQSGGVYVSYTTGVKNGPGGYLGVQIKKSGGQFLFSIWDADRWTSGSRDEREPKPSNKLTWPLNMKNCKRNCQDCGMSHLKKWREEGLTTGTQCKLPFSIRTRRKYEITLERTRKQRTIDTRDYGGMPATHEKFGEVDRKITGAVWKVKVTVLKRDPETITIGEIMFEGDGEGMHRLGTFDEMLGCNKCNAIYHRDTRTNLKVVYDSDNTSSSVIKMEGRAKVDDSTCKDYSVSGSKRRRSLRFEGGPLLQGERTTTDSYVTLWDRS